MTRRRSPALRMLSVLLAVVGLAAGGRGIYAAFAATTVSGANSISSGTVRLADNDAGQSALTLSDVLPGASDTSCITVTYSGSLPATVRIFGSTTGTGLDQYLDLTIIRGTYSESPPGFDSCTNFTADATDYIGAGAGVIYSGPLQGFPDGAATALADPSSSDPAVWTSGDSRVYRLHVTLRNESAAAGKDATQTFTWEALNE